MSRVIKFRAWHKTEQKMYSVETLSFSTQDHPVAIGLPGMLPLNGEYLLDGISLILMQFTGLTDGNNREMYEGDIVQLANKSQPPFALKEFSWFYGTEWEESCYGYDFHGHDSVEVEIIGNIYEHSHLLRTKK